MEDVKKLLREKNSLSHQVEGITIVTSSEQQGIEFTKELLYRTVDTRTFLLLSGGRTPKDIYSSIAKDEKIHPGAVGQIDERYGPPFHPTSNQKMLDESGLLRYFIMRDISFYPYLKGENLEVTADQYDKTLREFFSLYRNLVGILGIGLDGHTAGVPADKDVWTEYEIAQKGKTEYVVYYDDHGRFYNQRVTMTFLGLSMLDLLIVLVFGTDKKEALEKMLSDGSEEEAPSRFYKRPDIAKKTVIITDQSI